MRKSRKIRLGRFGRGPSLGGSALILGARYVTGGMEWQESAVHLSRTADGHYLRGGELLVAESDITEGTTLSSYRPWPTNAGVIVGQPATTRTGGLDQCDDDNYGLIAAASSSMSVLIDLDITGLLSGATRVVFIGSESTKWRWGFMFTSVLELRIRIYNPSNSIVAEVVLSGNFQIGDRVQIFATLEWDGVDATIYAKKWGRSTTSGTDTVAAADEFMGGYFFGRSVGTGSSLDSRVTIRQAAAWDGVVKTPTEGDTMVASVQSGGLIGVDVATDADVKVRGITAGFYDAADTSWLPEIAGSGAPVYAEDIANPIPITVPAVSRAGTGDDWLRTLSVVPTLPEAGTVVVAISADAYGTSGASFFDCDTGTGGVRTALVTTTAVDRGRMVRGGRLADASMSGLTPNDNDVTDGSPLFFLLVRWSAAGVAINTVQGGVVLGTAGAAYVNVIDGVTDILEWLEPFAGRMSWAILNENIDSTIGASLCVDFYSPRNIGLSRGTLWYAPGFAVAHGADITSVSDIVNLGSARNTWPEWEIVSGSARLDGASS